MDNFFSLEEISFNELEPYTGGEEIPDDGCALFNGNCTHGGCGFMLGNCSAGSGL